MKRTTRMACALLLALAFLCAEASVSATPNQKLAFRTGPNTKYAELYSLPQSTAIRAIEYEEGNGVTWVLVEYTYKGSRCRAYTGLKRMTVHGTIPWADHIGTDAYLTAGADVYAAPSYDAAYRSYVARGTRVTLLRYEGGYAFIEFSDGGTPSRGYVDSGYIGTDGGRGRGGDRRTPAPGSSVPATPNQRLAFRSGPNTKYVFLYNMPETTPIRAIEYEEGNGVTWVLVEFTREGLVCRAYTGLKRMAVHGTIPWADHLDRRVSLSGGGTVYAAPTYGGAYRGHVDRWDTVTLLRWEGAWAYIEFSDGGTPSRGYVEAGLIAY